ncbi:hypothetical protein [Haloarchaeobius sp. DT45]|uniref:hypothetical protein n=1 Tax=Haloarchaeobius sp. DT45 TaxID=3446116 RepID=UPI003F6D8B45
MRQFPLVLAFALLLALGGCTGSLDGDTADETVGSTTVTPTTVQFTERPTPERPTEFTNGNVETYVESAEEVYLYNRAIRDHAEVHVNCRVQWRERTDDGFRMGVGCGISMYDTDDGNTVVGDGYSRATYVVTENETERRDEFVDPPTTTAAQSTVSNS